MIKLLILLFIILPVNADVLPDKSLSPGKSNPELTKEVICSKNFTTKDYRNVSSGLKQKIYNEYNTEPNKGICGGSEGCEVDHIIPLTIGGSNDKENLWVQPFNGQLNAHDKDQLEVRLHRLVCSDIIDLQQAQNEISSDWVKAFNKYILIKEIR